MVVSAIGKHYTRLLSLYNIKAIFSLFKKKGPKHVFLLVRYSYFLCTVFLYGGSTVELTSTHRVMTKVMNRVYFEPVVPGAFLFSQSSCCESLSYIFSSYFIFTESGKTYRDHK